MKRWAACLCVVLAAGLLPAADAEKEGSKATVGEGGEILFPAKPKEITTKGNKQFVLERMEGKVALLLQANELPAKVDITDAMAVKQIADAGRTALVKAFKGAKLVSEKDFKFDKKYPARDIDVEVPAFGVYRVRFIVTPTHFYQVTVLGPKDYQDGEEAKKFMNSFKLKDKE